MFHERIHFWVRSFFEAMRNGQAVTTHRVCQAYCVLLLGLERIDSYQTRVPSNSIVQFVFLNHKITFSSNITICKNFIAQYGLQKLSQFWLW